MAGQLHFPKIGLHASGRTWRWPSSVAWLHTGAGCLLLALLTFGAFRLNVNLTTISFTDLVLVFCVAYFGGFRQASVVSVLAFASLDYFFTLPRFEFRVSDPRDWAALATFEISALIIARLSARELRSAREAAASRIAMVQLYELSRSCLLLDFHRPPGAQLVVLIQRIFRVEAVAIFDLARGHEEIAGDWGANEPVMARQAYLDGVSRDDPRTRTVLRVLRVNSRAVGALAIRGDIPALVADALAALAEFSIARCASLENEERAEKVSRREELRTAVLDSLAHELKTPLASIQAAASGLVEFGKLGEMEAQLAELIDQQTHRLNTLCAKLLVSAKPEAAAFPISVTALGVASVLADMLDAEPLCRLRSRVRLTCDDPELMVHADRALLSMILQQFIDNAGKYSTPGTPIHIEARKGVNEVIISVGNRGPVIPLEDRERVFDRFYRSPDDAHRVAGTGIGLSVAKKAAAALHGHVWVVSSEAEGTTFSISIPENRESI